MSEWLAYAGGAFLAAATLPQALRLARTRDASDMTWGFVLLNVLGIGLLALRSIEIREWGFVAVNLITVAFWALAAVVKATGSGAIVAPPAMQAPDERPVPAAPRLRARRTPQRRRRSLSW